MIVLAGVLLWTIGVPLLVVLLTGNLAFALMTLVVTSGLLVAVLTCMSGPSITGYP